MDRRLRPPGLSHLLLLLMGGGVLNTTLARLGVVGHVDRARPLALFFLAAAVVLGLCSAAHRSLRYCDQLRRTHTVEERKRVSRLSRAVDYETWLAVYFFGAWALERSWPNETVEFLLASCGFGTLLVIGGRVHRLAADLGLPSITSSLLESPAAQELKNDLEPWLRKRMSGAEPPLVRLLSKVLHLLPEVGSVSIALTLTATLIAGVASADLGAATQSAGTGISVIYRVLEPASPAEAGEAPKSSQAASAAVSNPSGAAGFPEHTTDGPSSQPTYATLCGAGDQPGRKAPGPTARSLYDLWLGPRGVGGLVAGCAEPAKRVRAGSGTWYVAGRSGPVLLSLGVAASDGSAALLLGEGARFAFASATAGSLISASPRVRVGLADLQLINTQSGTYVLVRATVRPNVSNSQFVIVPPGLVGAWLAAARETSWTWPVAVSANGGERSYEFETAAGKIMGEARCENDASCVSRLFDVRLSTHRGEYATLSQIEAVAPGAAG